jgi:hypothetical protein
MITIRYLLLLLLSPTPMLIMINNSYQNHISSLSPAANCKLSLLSAAKQVLSQCMHDGHYNLGIPLDFLVLDFSDCNS